MERPQIRRRSTHSSAHVEPQSGVPLWAAWSEMRRNPVVLSLMMWWRFQWRWARRWCAQTVDKGMFQALMFFITVYALIGDDVRTAFLAPSADFWFAIATIIALVVFFFELVAASIGKDDYLFSFFFWLDLIATGSMILDIPWVMEAWLQDDDSSIARAGRMSKVGTRAGRVIRMIRLIRLIRIIKLYKHVFDFWKKVRKDEEAQKPGEHANDDEMFVESRVGQKLSHMTTQKVILLILFMLIMLPIISVEEFFRDTPTSSQYGADMISQAYNKCYRNGSSNAVECEDFKKQKQNQADNWLLTLRVDAIINATQNQTYNRSATDCLIFEQQLTLYVGYHHQQKDSQCNSSWKMAFRSECKLALGWIAFHKCSAFVAAGYKQGTLEDHWNYLNGQSTNPAGRVREEFVEEMNSGNLRACDESNMDYRYTSLTEQINCPGQLRLQEQGLVWPRLSNVYDAPDMMYVFDLRPWMLRSAVYNILQTVFICIILAVGAMVFSHDANVLVLQPIERMISKVETIRDNPLYAMKLGDESYRQKQEQEGRSLKRCCWCRRRNERMQTLETKILENAIIKLGKLLALGFGEAGSEIIGKNMGNDSATVNAMIPGNMVEAVFGFCYIRNFTDTTEVLQDKIMVFVNQVAEIVHNIVDTWHGAANRNIGDAFLIVWRMREDFTPAVRKNIGDMSVISFIKVLAAINKSAVLKDYRDHPALLARLPNYRVRMGFGLHYGWAVEGAIGSEFKIDASYLSPHVNMASRLEAVTKLYQVSILMSEPLSQLCSHEMARYFRTVDHVTLKGGMSTPIRLHTIDLYSEGLRIDYAAPKKNKNPFELRIQREKAKEEKLHESFQAHQLLEQDPDLKTMRKDFSPRFFQLFSKGYLNYEAGEWDVARSVFEATQGMLSKPDGPSKVLLNFMGQFSFDSSKATPKGWLHYRELIEG